MSQARKLALVAGVAALTVLEALLLVAPRGSPTGASSGEARAADILTAPDSTNGMALDSDPDDPEIDAVAAHPLGETFQVSGNVTVAEVAYAGYYLVIDYDATKLEFVPTSDLDHDTVLESWDYTELGNMALQSAVTVQVDVPAVGVNRLTGSAARAVGTTSAVGKATLVTFRCTTAGSAGLHLVAPAEATTYSTTTGPEGTPIATTLADASIACGGVTSTPTPTPTITPTPAGTATPTATPPSIPDSDGDGCDDVREQAMGFDYLAWYDFYDVPTPARPDPDPNGSRTGAVDIGDVLAVLLYSFTEESGGPNANGVSYDSLKDGDWNGDTFLDAGDKVGLRYDRAPGPQPDPPWEAGPPNGAIDIGDVLAALAQFGLDCNPQA